MSPLPRLVPSDGPRQVSTRPATSRALAIVACLACAFAPSDSSAAESLSASANSPNIVIILADDLGIGDPRCYNADSRIQTPSIDRIAREGKRFSDVHSPSAVCTPTRYALLTGRYAWRGRLKSGVLHGYSRSLIEPGRATIASLLRERGYVTAGFGKWHLGLQSFDPDRTDKQQPVDFAKPLRPGPLSFGFSEFFGIPASLDMDPYVFIENEHAVEKPTGMIAESGDTRGARGAFWRRGAIARSFRHANVLPRITERAVAFLDQQAAAQTKKPFFLYFALSAPHTPYLPAEKYRGRSGAGDYGDFVEMADASVGQVLDALDRNGQAGNTLLIFTSDNGARWTPEEIRQFGHRSNLNNRGQKSDIYEGGHRIPLLARWPGRIRPRTTSDELGCLVDLSATCAAAASAPLPANAAEDSFNLLPILLDEPHSRAVRDTMVMQSGGGLFAIRHGDWKLVTGLGSGGFTRPQRIEPKPGEPAVQLYNLRLDRQETQNVAAAHPDVVQSLTHLLDGTRHAGRSRPIPNLAHSSTVSPGRLSR